MADSPRFRGFGPAAFDWLDAIAEHNDRPFFEATRATYDEELRAPFTALLHECAAWTGGRPRVFRALRDMRFERHRARPYWESIAGEIVHADRATTRVAALTATGLTASAGRRRPFSAEQLRRYRAAVDDPHAGPRLAELVDLHEATGGAVHGATLRGAPRGMSSGHPLAALLRHTALWASVALPVRGRADRRTIGRDIALRHLSAGWAGMAALSDWIDEHVSDPAEEAAA